MKLLERTISLLAPFSCLVCGDEGSPLCQGCAVDAFEAIPSTCYICNKLSNNFRVCNDCERRSALLHVWVASNYDGVAKQLVRGLKYDRRRAYAVTIAEILDDALPYFAKPPILTHLPTTTIRRRKRGFDHAALVARELSRLRRWDYLPLLRRLDQSHQVGSTRAQRLAQPLEFVASSNVRDKTVVILDDVITTGRSLEAAASVLRRAGARHVSAVAVAINRRQK